MEKLLINTGPSARGWHRLELALRCLRLYAMSWMLRINGGSRAALVRGSLLHIGQAHIYAQMRAAAEGGDPGRYYDPLDAIDVAAQLPEFVPHGQELASACKSVTSAYMRRYAAERVRVLAVEEVVEADFGGKYRITQRWDLLRQDPSGRVWVRDHKSASRPTAMTVLRYSLSGQFLIAQLIGQARYGDKFGGVELNLLGTEADKGGGYKFLREVVKPAPAALARFSRDMIEVEDRLAALEAEGRDPWEYPGAWNEHACVTAYGPCAYYSLCQWGKNWGYEVRGE